MHPDSTQALKVSSGFDRQKAAEASASLRSPGRTRVGDASRDHERGSPGCLHCTLFSDTHITRMWKWGLSVEDSALSRLAYAYVFVYICIFP